MGMAHHAHRESRLNTLAGRHDLEEAGMIQSVLKRIFHIPEMIIVLTLMALACLPLALSNIVRDAGVSLLLPLTLSAALVTWALANRKVRTISSLLLLLGVGPLILFIRISQTGTSIIEALKQILLVPVNLIKFGKTIDLLPLLNAREDLAGRLFAINQRLALWSNGLMNGVQIEDPVVRTLVWSLALWLIAVWAGWQVFRRKRLLAGVLPSTVVLAFVLDYTGRESQILWVHLALLLFLYGLTSYEGLLTRWKTSNMDYADSTGIDTLGFVGALTVGLVAVAFLSATISVRDILENLRDRTQESNTTQAEALGLESDEDNFRVMGFSSGLPRSYLISAGPEISRQLAMTISTGDLPPMPESARPVAPRYYWRTLTFQTYTGSGWSNPSSSAEEVASEQPLFETPSANYRIVNQQVTYPNDTVGRLYWTGTLLRADIPFQANWIREDNIDPLLNSNMLAALATVESYTAESLLLDVNANELRASPPAYPDWVREQFLTLPDSVPERVRALARDLTASEATPYDRAIAIQNHLREFPYTLEVRSPPPGRDVADYFLFDLQQGYCDYYATTMVVLARAAGIPARLVVGYSSGLYEAEQAHYLVTENYAHSWVEIYFTDIGWVEFEPTASQAAILYAEEGETVTAPPVEQADEPFAQRFARYFEELNLWLPVAIFLGMVVSWLAWDSLRLARLEPARAMQLLYARLRRLARPLHGTPSMDQTAHQYASSLIRQVSKLAEQPQLQSSLAPSSHEIHQLTELYARSLFAPSPLTHRDVHTAMKVWSQLRWRILLANMLKISKGKKRTRVG
jgi:transglutaminase-like putative cysteine protease